MAKDKKNVYYGTGRRKASIAKVKLIPGKGRVTVNGKDVHEYLPYETLVMDLMQPLELTKTNEIFDVEVAKVNIMNVVGKKKRMGRYVGMTAASKKAIVTLTDSSKEIEFFQSL